MSDQLREVFQRLEELERRVSQMVVRGKVSEVDLVTAKAKVEYGDNLTTGWLPWKPIRTGKAIVWWAPEVGEGVTVISEGDLVLGEIYPGSYQTSFPAPSSDADVFLVEFGDGSKVSHNRQSHKLDVVNVGDVEITTQQNITVNCETANVEALGNIIANGSNIKLNSGKGVVTGECICQFTGKPHSDISSTVTAGK
jgi:phage baseplate assembly protein V